ncbi:MAG: winged helix-turn-helix domain-containing tetratricopeptide repeat protein [Rhizobiaceae bacterium]
MQYRFADMTLDTRLAELHGGDGPVKVEPKVLRLITYLIENADHVVSKDELIEKVWDGRIVSDAALNSRINAARRAVGDSGSEQKIIKTLSRRGFRFIADLQRDIEPGGSAPEPGLSQTTHTDQLSVSLSDPGSIRDLHVDPASPLERPAIAVIPFTNMSGDAEQEYFADGLTEDMITALSNWRSFPVIARNSVFAYKGKAIDVRTVAGELGARFLLEGSVRTAGGRVRITAQLVDANSGHHIWAERLDRELDDIFDVQDEITHQLAAVVAPELERSEQRRIKAKRPSNLSAWEYYHRGQAHLSEFIGEEYTKAREMFEKAIALDPNYSDAFVGIFQTHSRNLMESNAADPAETKSAALAAAKRAVELDEASSNARYALGNSYLWLREFDAAVTELETALQLNPSNALARVILGNVLNLSGRHEEAIHHIETGTGLNPMDSRAGHFFKTWLAEAHFCNGDDEMAANLARAAIRHRAGYPLSNLVLGCALACSGSTVDAKAALAQCEREKPGFIRNWLGWELYTERALERFREGLQKTGWKA